MIEVLVEAFNRSQSKGTDRCVMLALAEWASKDGITWHTQEEIAERANCDAREVRRAVSELVRLVELEVRKVQRGRARINVYRVVVGKIGWRDVDYDRLPFEVSEPFSPPDDLSARRVALARDPGGARDGAKAPGTTGQIVRPSGDATTGQNGSSRADISDRDDRTPSRVRVEEPSLEPKTRTALDALPLHKNGGEERAGDAGQGAGDLDLEELKSALVDAIGRRPSTRSEHGEFAGALLQLREVGATPEQLLNRVARYRRRWPDAVVTPSAIVKHWSLFALDAEAAATGSGVTKRSWVEKTSWKLDVDDAHMIVDDWADLDASERQELHELVDQVRADRAAASESAAA